MGLAETKNLYEVREGWEEGLTVVQEFDLFTNQGCVVIVLEITDDEHPDFSGSAAGVFQVLRYFQVGTQWYASVDLQAGNFTEVLKAINEIVG